MINTKEYITTSLLGSGYAAIHMIWCTDIPGIEGYWDIQQTGCGRYRTKEEAIVEAKMWSESDELEYVE